MSTFFNFIFFLWILNSLFIAVQSEQDEIECHCDFPIGSMPNYDATQVQSYCGGNKTITCSKKNGGCIRFIAGASSKMKSFKHCRQSPQDPLPPFPYGKFEGCNHVDTHFNPDFAGKICQCSTPLCNDDKLDGPPGVTDLVAPEHDESGPTPPGMVRCWCDMTRVAYGDGECRNGKMSKFCPAHRGCKSEILNYPHNGTYRLLNCVEPHDIVPDPDGACTPPHQYEDFHCYCRRTGLCNDFDLTSIEQPGLKMTPGGHSPNSAGSFEKFTLNLYFSILFILTAQIIK